MDFGWHGAVDIKVGIDTIVYSNIPSIVTGKEIVGKYTRIYTVVDATLPGMGLVVVAYTHVDGSEASKLTIGQRLNPGDKIAKIADWGGKTHLHLEILSKNNLADIPEYMKVVCDDNLTGIRIQQDKLDYINSESYTKTQYDNYPGFTRPYVIYNP